MVRKLVGIEHLSEELAWELVSPQFSRRFSVAVGALSLVLVGLAGWGSGGPALYGVCGALTSAATAWRLRDCAQFIRARARRAPAEWAVRGMLNAWALGGSWGLWALLVPLERRPGMLVALLGVHAALVTGAAVRNFSLPVVARGQAMLAAVPMSLACLLSPDAFVKLYGGLALLNVAMTMTLVRGMHREKLQLLLNEVQAAELSAKLAAANDELAVVNQHLEALVATDPLTGLLNRRAFDLAAARAWRVSVREEQPLALLMVDIDYFKLFNDHYGHQAGDECLRTVAVLLGEVVHRPSDVVARYGGEEFILVLPGTDGAGAATVAEGIVLRLNERALVHATSPSGRVTVSVGAAAVTRARLSTLHRLIADADGALYAAKRLGRNCAQVRAGSEDAAGAEDPLCELWEEVGPG